MKSKSDAISFTFRWTEERWLEMLWDLEYAIRRQRLKWVCVCWVLGPALLLGFFGWTVILSLKISGVPLFEPPAAAPGSAPDFAAVYWQTGVALAILIALWPLTAWAVRKFFSRMMLGTFRREAVCTQPQTWRIGADEIHISTGRGSSSLRWSEVTTLIRTRTGFWLGQSRERGLFLPHFALEESGHLARFEELAACTQPAEASRSTTPGESATQS